MNNDELEAAKPRYWRESSLEAVHFCQRLRLENGVTLLYDDQRGLAEGSDGRIYYAVCRELPGPEEDMEILGWSAEIDEEFFFGMRKEPGRSGVPALFLCLWGVSSSPRRCARAE